ncbi:MAG: nicotinamide mononucleotide transporter [Clostridia bacterium]|nr:nicotinamide mononucleotide transporter [Clostridia bacterium]
MKNNGRSDIYQNYQRNLIKATVATNVGINNTDKIVQIYGASANRVELLRRLRKYSKFTIVWYITFFLLGLVCFALSPSSWFYVIDLYVVMINIDLVARGKLVGMYIGIFECFLYSFNAMQSGLWGEIIKNLLICVPLNIVSIVNWTKSLRKQKYERYSSKTEEDIVVRKLSKLDIFKFSLIGVVVFGGCYVLLRYILPLIGIVQDTALVLGALSLTITIISKILTSKKFMETWILGISGSIICLLMWGESIITGGFNLAQVSMIVYYLACFTNDVYAYSLWKSMYRKIAVNGGKILAMRKVNIRRIIKLKRQFRSLHWDKKIDMSKNS